MRDPIKKSTKIFLVCSGAVAFWAFVHFQSLNKFKGVSIRNADVAPGTRNERMRVRAGKGTVVALMKDQTEFEECIFWIPNLQESSFELGDRDHILGYFKKGKSVNEIECSVELKSGKVDILSLRTEHIKLHVSVDFECVQSDGSKNIIHIDQGFALTDIRIDQF